jgi:hypothetical protein
MGFPDGNYARAAWLSSVREVDREWQVDRREKRFGLIQAIRTGYQDVITRTYVNSARGRAPGGESEWRPRVSRRVTRRCFGRTQTPARIR